MERKPCVTAVDSREEVVSKQDLGLRLLYFVMNGMFISKTMYQAIWDTLKELTYQGYATAYSRCVQLV